MSQARSSFPDESVVSDKAAGFVPAMEALASRSPARFRFRVALHLVLGYAMFLSAVFFALLIGLLAVFAAVASRAIWLVAAGLGSFASGFALLQSLNVQIPPPKGILIPREDAPQLHAVVEELTAETKAPRIDSILLIPEANASITSRFVNGLYGKASTTLRLGLPLLQLLSPGNLRALLHHEFAHSSGGHGHTAIWTTRAWESWTQLPLIEQEMGFSARLILPSIFRWFVPKLTAYSAVLSRVHEFIADRHALKHSGDANLDEMLVRIELASQFMECRFWPEIWKEARDLPRVPAEVFSRLLPLARAVSVEDLRAWTKSALQYKSRPLDSHPDLSTRLRAVESSVDPEQWTHTIESLGFVPTSSAASEYFGRELARYEKELAGQWARGSFLIWEDHFKIFERNRKILAQLKECEKGRNLNAEEMIQRALCIWNLDGPAASEPLLRSAQAAYPNSPEFAFHLGRCLLALDKEEGIAFIERVISLATSQGRYEGTIAICEYLRRHERDDEAIAFFNRMVQEDEVQRKIAFERGNISLYDPVISHGLDAQRMEKISSKVRTLDWVREAFFCRKPTPLSPGQPLYLLALKPRRGFLIPAFHQGMTAFDQVAALNCYPIETRFLLLDGSQPTLEKKIRKLPDSLLFKR
jgi:Zn-dependent protease with chaperone function